MPHNRSYSRPYLGSSPYPTGRSPLVLDLESKMSAITQQIIENRKQEIKDKKLEIKENEKLVIDALDFEPLAEAGDKWQQQHAKDIDEFTNRWAKKLYEKNYKLSTADKIQLNKEKREIEKKRAVAESEIKTIAEIKKELGKREKSIYELGETMKNMQEYQDKGLIGSGGAINIPVLKKIPFGAGLMEKYEPFVKEKAETFVKQAQVVDRNTGKVQMVGSNEKAVNDAIDIIKTTPDYKELYEQSPEQAEALLNELKIKYLKQPSEEKFVSAVKYPQAKTEEVKSSMFPELKTKAQIEGAAAFNDIAERIWQQDESALIMFKGNTYETIQVEPDRYILTTNPTTTGKRTTVEIERNIDKLDFKMKLWDFAPRSLKQGLTNIPSSAIIKKDWELERPVQKAELSKVRALKDSFEKVKLQYSDIDKRDRDFIDVVNDIKDLLGDEISDKDIKVRSRGVKFRGKTYDIRKSAEKKQLFEIVLKEAGMEETEEVQVESEKTDAETKAAEVKAEPEKEEETKDEVKKFRVPDRKGVFNIPANRVDEFLKDYPNAELINE